MDIFPVPICVDLRAQNVKERRIRLAADTAPDLAGVHFHQYKFLFLNQGREWPTSIGIQ